MAEQTSDYQDNKHESNNPLKVLFAAIKIDLRASLVRTFLPKLQSPELRQEFRTLMDADPPDPDRLVPLDKVLRFAHEHTPEFSECIIQALVDFECELDEALIKGNFREVTVKNLESEYGANR